MRIFAQTRVVMVPDDYETDDEDIIEELEDGGWEYLDHDCPILEGHWIKVRDKYE